MVIMKINDTSIFVFITKGIYYFFIQTKLSIIIILCRYTDNNNNVLYFSNKLGKFKIIISILKTKTWRYILL